MYVSHELTIRCGEFMYMGKKFNSRQEKAAGEKYKGIQVLRFYIKCGTCSNMMTFKTDPERSDYAMESGGTRTFEMWQEANAVAADNQEERRVGENDDAMTTLENRTRDTQKMVDMLDQLDELKAMSQRNQRIDADALMRAADEKRKLEESEPINGEDEQLVKSIKFASVKKSLLDEDGEDKGSDSDLDSDESNAVVVIDPLKSLVKQRLQADVENISTRLPVVKKIRKLKNNADHQSKKPKKEEDAIEVEPPSGLAGLTEYGSSGDSD